MPEQKKEQSWGDWLNSINPFAQIGKKLNEATGKTDETPEEKKKREEAERQKRIVQQAVIGRSIQMQTKK